MKRYKIDQYKIRYEIDQYVCQKCGRPATQIAHRIAQTKASIKKYTEKIINHNYNLVPVCGLECNSHFNIGNNPGKIKKLINIIKNSPDKNLKSSYINHLLED